MRFGTFLRSVAGATILAAAVANGGVAMAADEEHEIELPDTDFSFSGPFGTFDHAAAQRGFMVYRQVCSACHGLRLIYYRDLVGIGVPEGAVDAIASQTTVMDGPNDEGEMYERQARPSDRIPSPFPNEKAARAANGGAYPPDLSLVTEAREGGSDYIHAILTGFQEAPPGTEVPDGMYYNAYFPGHMIAMPPPLSEGIVDYPDETKPTVDQMATDVATFLAYAAEPNMDTRKRTGIAVLIFLVILTVLLYMVKRKIWSKVH